MSSTSFRSSTCRTTPLEISTNTQRLRNSSWMLPASGRLLETVSVSAGAAAPHLMQRRVCPHFVHLIDTLSSVAFSMHISKRCNPRVDDQLMLWLNLGKRNSCAHVLPSICYMPECLEDFTFIDDLNSDPSPRWCRQSWDDTATERTQIPGSLTARVISVETGNDERPTRRVAEPKSHPQPATETE